MPATAIYQRYVFHSRFHPLPRRGNVTLFSATADTKSVSQPPRRRAPALAIIEEKEKQEWAARVRRTPYVHVPPVEDTFSYVWPHVQPPRARGVWFHPPRWHHRHIVHGKVTVIPPTPPSSYEGALRSKVKLTPTYRSVVTLEPTYDSEVEVMWLSGKNSNDISVTLRRQDTGAAVTDATMECVIYDPDGVAIDTVTLSYFADDEYRGTTTQKLAKGVPYELDIYATDYNFQRLATEKVQEPRV